MCWIFPLPCAGGRVTAGGLVGVVPAVGVFAVCFPGVGVFAVSVPAAGASVLLAAGVIELCDAGAVPPEGA